MKYKRGVITAGKNLKGKDEETVAEIR